MGRLTQGHEFKKTGTTGGTLEATSYIICINPFEIDPQKGNRGGKNLLCYCQKPNQELDDDLNLDLNDYGTKVIYALMFLNCELS